MKQYFTVKNEYGTNSIELTVYYHKGGLNYFTGTDEKRGIYMSLTPVDKGNGVVSFTAFSGRKWCLLTLNRKSQKQLDRIEAVVESFEQQLVEAFAKGDDNAVRDLYFQIVDKINE